MKIYANEPAIPHTYEEEVGDYGMKQQQVYNGLSKREYFAAMAMQGILSDQTYVRPNSTEEVSRCAVAMADALIAELNKISKI